MIHHRQLDLAQHLHVSNASSALPTDRRACGQQRGAAGEEEMRAIGGQHFNFLVVIISSLILGSPIIHALSGVGGRSGFSSSLLSSSRLPSLHHGEKGKWLFTRRGGSYNQGYGGGSGGYDYNDNPYDGYAADGYDDEDDYDEQYRYPPQHPPRQPSTRRGRASAQQPPSSRYGSRGTGSTDFASIINTPVPPQIKNFGFTLLGIGIAVTALGCSLFFEKNLIRLGNLCFLAGLPLYLGPARVLRMFLARTKLRATICFGVGVALVLRGNSFLGLIIEVFGLLNLFANFFPLALVMLRQIPFVGDLLKRPQPGSAGSRRDDYYGSSRGYDYDRRDQDW